MTFAPGFRLGPYEITAKIGEGGMGEVWKAKDLQLERDVALKVLPESLAADPERLARFEREAKLLAQLNHPNIAQIYGLEVSGDTRALVMELVDGPTLAERLEQERLPITESLSISLQIALALEEAHEKGIVHRDLKPQNVKASKASVAGKVKVLDFGLAKAMDPTLSATGTVSQLAQSPTLTIGATQMGVILGTAAYMAPEQAKGVAVDKRADIWAFGVLLYEMLTGGRLFPGDSVTETLAAVLRNEIDFEALPAATPYGLRRLLRRCLERDPRSRLRDIGEARIAIQAALDPSSAEARSDMAPAAKDAASRTASSLRALPWLLVLLLAASTLWLVRRGGSVSATGTAARSPVLALHLPAGLSIPLDDRGIYGQTGLLAIAPDGSRIAFLEGVVGKGPIYVRELESDELKPLDGTAGASSPFFSPDGRWIAYFSPGKMRKVSVEGGRPIDLADSSLDRGGVWCPDGSIVFAPNATTGLFRLAAGASAPKPLTELDVAHGERTHRWPALLPGGREVAFTIGRAGQPGDYEDSQIDAVELATGKRRPLFRGASMVRFTTSGLALLGRAGQILAAPLEGAHGQSAEDARQVLRNVAGVPASGVVHFAVADDGTLVYAEHDPHADELELAWYTQTGEVQPLALPRGQYRIVRFSPDGKRVAMAVGAGGGGGGDVWILDLASGALSKLTFDGRSWSPIWTRDGKGITFQTQLASGGESFRQRPADGSREAETLFSFDQGRARAPVAWMPDGSLLFWEDGGAGSAGNLLYLPPGGGEARPFASTPAIEIQPAVSRDGRFVAYDIDETGLPEIYVQPFPPTGAKWQVAEGASVALWSTDGRELYFIQGRELMVVPVSTTGTFAFGSARKLMDFPTAAVLTNDTATSYDVARDGRFLTVRTTSTEPMGGHLVVVLNWFEKLKRTAAAGSP